MQTDTTDEKLTLDNEDTNISLVKTLGTVKFPWKVKVKELLEQGKITQQERDNYFAFRESSITSNIQGLSSKLPTTYDNIVCDACGAVINSGNNGTIYQSSINPTKVIKGAKFMLENSPFDFEVRAYKAIASVFPSDLKVVSMVETGEVFTERGRKFFEMDKISPVRFTEEQLTKILELKSSTSDNVMLTALEDWSVNSASLLILVPAVEEDSQKPLYNEGGGANSNWREINKPVILALFDILGISFSDYENDIVSILTKCFKNNVYLNDIEFIFGSRVDSSDNTKVGVFMIDFDKVAIGSNLSITNTLSTDYYSSSVRSRIMEEMRKSKSSKSLGVSKGGKSKKPRKRRKSMKKNQKLSQKRQHTRKNKRRTMGNK